MESGVGLGDVCGSLPAQDLLFFDSMMYEQSFFK